MTRRSEEEQKDKENRKVRDEKNRRVRREGEKVKLKEGGLKKRQWKEHEDGERGWQERKKENRGKGRRQFYVPCDSSATPSLSSRAEFCKKEATEKEMWEKGSGEKPGTRETSEACIAP